MSLLGARFRAGLALLYGGPVLAGWAGLPLALSGGFALIFLAWLVLARPALHRPPLGWSHQAIWAQLALTMAVQMGLALACGAAGLALRQLIGGPEVAFWPAALGTLALSALALTQAPRLAALYDPAFQATLDEMLATLESMPPPDPAPPPACDPGPTDLVALLARELDPVMARNALGQGDLSAALHRALAEAPPPLLRDTARRAAALLDREPALLCEMPAPEAVRAAAVDQADPATVSALLDWSEILCRLDDEERNGPVRRR